MTAPAVTAHYAVLLVHGVCSDSTSWDSFKAILRSRGLPVYTMNLTPNDERPQKVVGQLAAKMASIPGPRVNLVAHSMGGLVSREFIAAQVDNHLPTRVGKLVTLGTPHHGSDGASWLAEHKGLQTLGAPFCPVGAPAFKDLVTGSDFLNGLNYGAGPGESRSVDTSKPHPVESLRDPSIAFSTIGGTGEWCGWLGSATSPAWIDEEGAHMANDGLVSVFSAHLTAPGTQGWNDSDLGLSPLTHRVGMGSCLPSLQDSPELANDVADILNGQPPTPMPAKPPIAANPPVGPAVATSGIVDLPEISGVLSPGQTAEVPVSIPGTSLLRAYLVAAPDVAFRLRTPDGILLTPADTAIVTGLDYLVDPIGAFAYLQSEPDAGSWSLVIDGTAAPDSVPYIALVQVQSSRRVVVRPASGSLAVGESTWVQIRYESTGVPVLNTAWDCTWSGPDGAAHPFTPFDDGAHGDSGPSDGIFGARIRATAGEGLYTVTAIGTPPPGTSSARREGGATFEASTNRDIVVPLGSFHVLSSLVSAGDAVTVTVDVMNSSPDPITNLVVEFRDGDPGIVFATPTVDLNPGQTKTVQATWTAALPDSHVLRAIADPLHLSGETYYANNNESLFLVLGQTLDAGFGALPRNGIRLGPAQPNPSRGPATIPFALGATGPAEFEVFDLQGRRVRSWKWERLPAGRHSVTWDGRGDGGQLQNAGVYFYRLKAAGRVLVGRMVRLR